MKIKLPEGFELSKNTEDDSIYIHDKLNEQWAYRITSIKKALELICTYTNNLKLIKETKLPDDYKIITCGITDDFNLYYNDCFQKQSKNIQDLIKIATKKTDLDLQIKALNEGLEIEI